MGGKLIEMRRGVQGTGGKLRVCTQFTWEAQVPRARRAEGKGQGDKGGQ